MKPDDFFKHLFSSHSTPSEKPLVKVSSEEVVRFEEIRSRIAAYAADRLRVESKIQSDLDRLWADIKDKYNLHGKEMTYDTQNGAVVELLPPGTNP